MSPDSKSVLSGRDMKGFEKNVRGRQMQRRRVESGMVLRWLYRL